MKTNIKNTILLIIRILVGAMIAYAGYTKVTNMDATINAFQTYFNLSANITWAVSVGELLAGLGILFGVWTKLAALGSVIIMAGAVYYTKGQDISPILLLLGSIVLFITGSGRYAVKACEPLMKKNDVVVTN